MNSEQLSVSAQRIVDLINCRNHETLLQRFSSAAFQQVSPREAVTAISELIGDYGEIHRLMGPESLHPATFVAQFERGFLDLKLAFDSQGQIEQLSFVTPATNLAAVARIVADLINESNCDAIQKMFSRRMDHFLPAEKCSDFFRQLTGSLGRITNLEPPRPDGEWQVFRTFFERGLRDFGLTLDENGQIAGLYFRSPMHIREPIEKHHTRLILPLRGRWLVFWGGDTNDDNQHNDIPNQRFAFDFVGIDEQSRLFHGEGDRNDDYFAFGREVLAPADGTVIEVIDGVRDNTPGSMNPFSAVGNCVLLQHRDNEVSVFAHLKHGSIRVKPGNAIKQSQVIALCGNSGNSSAPHLHYHLQDGPVLQDGFAIRCVFDGVPLFKGGLIEPRNNYSPVRGDIIVAR